MKNSRNHFEDFILTGYWWLPGQQHDAVVGSVFFENNKDLKLELQGNLANAPEFGTGGDHRPKLLYGCSSKYERYTLLNNLRTNHVMNAPGYEVSKYSSRFLVIGEHIGPFDSPQISEVLVRFPGLEYSTGFAWFSRSDPNPARLQLTWTSPKTFTVWVPAIQAHLSSHFDVPGTGMPSLGPSNIHLTADHKAYLKLVPRVKVSLDWAWAKLLRLQHLLTLLYGFPTCPIEVELRLADGKRVELFFCQDKLGVEKEPKLSNMLVTLLPLKRHQRQELFRSWFRARTPFRAAAELLCGTFFQHGIYTRLEFVNHVQTLEAFHRAVYRNSGYYMKVDDYKTVKDTLIAAIPKTVSTAHRDKLKSAISYGYEKAQTKRIEELLNTLPTQIRNFITLNPKAFVRKLVDTRNRYTHYDPHDIKPIFDDHEMAVCNHGLRLFLLFLFLRSLRVPGNTLLKGLQRMQSWRIYSELRSW